MCLEGAGSKQSCFCGAGSSRRYHDSIASFITLVLERIREQIDFFKGAGSMQNYKGARGKKCREHEKK